MAYSEFPLETDPSTLALDGFVYLSDKFPGWQPAPGNFDTELIEANARIVAELRDLAASIPDEIFRRFGLVAGVPPMDAAPAVFSATVTALDDLGYVIEAGTLVAVAATGDERYLFEVDEDVEIPPGSTVTAVGEVSFTAQAESEGAAANGLAGDGVEVTLIDRTLPWVESIIAADETAGGVDEESTDDYLDRLAAVLQLQSARPVLARDFAALYAAQFPEVDRAAAIDLYVPGVNEKETVSHNGTGGTATLTYSGQTTGAIAWNAAAGAIQTALEALSNIAPGDVLVTGGPWPAAVTIEFRGALAETNVTQVTGSAASLTPGGSALTIATTVPGVAPLTTSEKSVTVVGVNEDGLPVSAATKTAGAAYLESMREVNYLVSVVDPTYTAIKVSYTATAYPGFDAVGVKEAADAALLSYLSPAEFGIVPSSADRQWVIDTSIRASELYAVLNGVDGLWKVTALSFARVGETLGTADVVMPGAAPLPTSVAADIVGTVTAA